MAGFAWSLPAAARVCSRKRRAAVRLHLAGARRERAASMFRFGRTRKRRPAVLPAPPAAVVNPPAPRRGSRRLVRPPRPPFPSPGRQRGRGAPARSRGAVRVISPAEHPGSRRRAAGPQFQPPARPPVPGRVRRLSRATARLSGTARPSGTVAPFRWRGTLRGPAATEDQCRAVREPHRVPSRRGLRLLGRGPHVAALEPPFHLRPLRRRQLHPEPRQPWILPHQLARAGFRVSPGRGRRVRPRLYGARGPQLDIPVRGRG